MLKCAPRAFARCPYRKQCSDSPEHTSFYEGTECDYFNQQVINKPMTNADSIRAMSDDELAEFLAEEQFRIANVVFQTVGYGLEKQVIYAQRLDWLQQPAEEEGP